MFYSRGILYLISDLLSVITISLCLVLKIPQILHLRKSKSTVGLSVYGLYLEMASYTVMMCYNYCNNYALLSYMEYPIIMVQEMVLIYLVLKYMKQLDVYRGFCIGIYFVIVIAFVTGKIEKRYLHYLVPFCTPVSASSKVFQLREILRTKDAKSVSVLTWFLSAFTNLTRIYTIYMDSGDCTLMANFTISTVLSSSVMFAAIYYGHQKSA